MKRSQQLSGYLQEVNLRLASLPDLKPGNHYNSPTPTLGLSVPQSRSALKEGYSFLKLSPAAILEAFDHIWNNAVYFEEMSQSIYFYEKKSLTENQFKVISGWIDRCDNWAHSDGLSSIYAKTLEEMPALVMPTLKKWNNDANPWKRRQSVVSLLYYARLRKSTPNFATMIEMVEELLDDPEYYVQKGVGWTLREIYNLHPKQTLDFIEKRVRQISPAAWQASTEKLPRQIKEQLLHKRRQISGR
jgi:3-methyladenine DNA glycosylase AlkD